MSRLLFAQEPAAERADFIYQQAAASGLPPYIVDKDFWVTWLLGCIFRTEELGGNCVFKGGTSLSKVFGAIHRFSEDIDLGLMPASLGFTEEELDGAPTVSQRKKRVAKVETACAKAVATTFMPKLEEVVRGVLGPPPNGSWLTYELEAASHSPVIWFAFPQAVQPDRYVAPLVKIEFGSLTDQRPTGTHEIVPMVAALSPDAFADFRAKVVALELERTFWEKATILHAEHHRPAELPFRDRFARHYADFAALWRHERGPAAAARLDLLERVRVHKSRYFASGWANYDTAVPGTLRLMPREVRMRELRRDYEAMRPMFLAEPVAFASLVTVLAEAERVVNQRPE